MKFGILAAAGIGALLCTTPTLASNAADGAMKISYKDLDLSTEQGREELEKRTLSAARKACGFDKHTTGTRMIKKSQHRCVEDNMERAKTAFAPIIEEQRLGG